MDRKTLQVLLITIFAVALTGGVLLATRWYINKPGEPLRRSDGTVIRTEDVINRGDITPTKTEPPQDALVLEVVEVGPVSNDTMSCPGDDGFSFWRKDPEYIDGGYALNRIYRCRIDDESALLIGAGGENQDGRPQWYDIVFEREGRAEERPLFTIAALDDPPAVGLKRINEFFLEVSWVNGSDDSMTRSAKVIDLGNSDVALDINWFGERAEIWKNGSVFVVERAVAGCDAESLGIAPQTTGITVGGTLVVNFDEPILPKELALDVGPCPSEPLFGDPIYDDGFFEVRFPFADEGTVVFDVATKRGRFEFKDGTVAKAWATYDSGSSGFALSYPAEWGLSADVNGGFCFSDSTNSPRPFTSDCIDWMGFTAFGSEVVSCKDFYLADVDSRPITMGDVDATDFTVRFCDDGGCGADERYVVACRNGKVFEWILSDTTNPLRYAQFDEMLSRFTFTSKFQSVQFPPTQFRADAQWPNLSSSLEGFSLRIPGEPTAYKCNTGSDAYFLCLADPNRSGDIWQFGVIHPYSGPYGAGGSACGENFEACLATIRTLAGDASVIERALLLPDGIRGYEIRKIDVIGGDIRWLVVEYTGQSGAFVMYQSGFTTMLSDIYERMLATISPWTG